MNNKRGGRRWNRVFVALALLLSGLLAPLAGRAQAPPGAVAPATPAAAPRRELAATRATQPLRLDGKLEEADWERAPATGQFTENRPRPGRPERHRTEVRVLYDDAALYVGAKLLEASPDSIMRELTQRDDVGQTDFFAVFLDPYRDHLNGYGFFVMSTGVQMDTRYSPAGGEDGAWNAVWESRVAPLPGGQPGWAVEMRIPYSAIRFSAAEVQRWGLNFMRQRKRDNQGFFWNEVKPEVDGFVNQWGELGGLQGLKPPLRLSLTPYVSGYVNHFPYRQQGSKDFSTSFNGGADVKWGLNESFTLDATLVPDFGQVQSDNVVLNLSPFEVQFQENRQFFTEGTELFNKGNLFYSRRVGAQPLGFYGVEGQLRPGSRGPDGQRTPGEFIVENPGVTRLLNATKVSGRTSKGLGIGVFNALSNNVYATVQDSLSGAQREVLTQPLSNYSILVFDQSLKNNSFVSLINTNVTRAGQTYDANVTGGLVRLANKANSYAFSGQLNYSRRRGRAFGSEAAVSDRDGYKYDLQYGKIGGGFQWRINHGIESDTYNPNDLGILFANNSVSNRVEFNFNKYKAFWKVNNFYSYAGIYQESLYRPYRYTEAALFAGFNTTFTKTFLTTGLNLDAAPVTHDFFEPRVQGTPAFGQVFVRVPATAYLGGFASSDYRKKFALDVNGGVRVAANDTRDNLDRRGRYGLDFSLEPRYRVSNQLTFRLDADWSVRHNQVGYVNGGLSASEPADQPLLGQTLLGRRQVTTVVNTLSGSYTFTNTTSLTIRTRHYTSHVRYRDFTTLGEDGRETPVPYARNRDNAFNAFNVDAFLTWWFAPGSQVIVAWKNAAATFLEADRATPLYFDNLQGTLNTPHNNNLSVRVLYFLDYLNVRPKRK